MTPEQQAGYAKAKKEAIQLIEKIGPEETLRLLARERQDLVRERLSVLQRDIGHLTAHAEANLPNAKEQLLRFARELRKVAGALDCAAAKAEVEAKK